MKYGSFPTVLAPLLRGRTMPLVLSAAALLQVTLAALGLEGWRCPFLNGLGVPCPGCGLTRSALALARGDWAASLAFHAFAPVLMAGLSFVCLAPFLSARARQRLSERVGAIESRFGLTTFVAVGMFLYWLVRLALHHEHFLQLVR